MLKKTLFAIMTATAAFAAMPTAAQVSFEGETIEFWVPFREGGGTDVWARSLVPHLSEALPGNPTVVVINNTQGGGVGGANEFHRRMEPHGQMVLGTSGSIQIPYLLNDPRVRYDYDDWTPVFASPAGGVVYVPTDTGIADASEIMEIAGTGAKYGSQGVASLDLVPLLAFELLGLDVEAIFGMQSRSNALQAIQRGELQIDYQTTPSYLQGVQPLVEEGTMVPLFAWGALDANGNIVRDPTFPDMPSFPEVYEMVNGEAPDGPAWEAWKAFYSAGFGAQKFVMLPAETDQAIVQAYRDAFAAIMNDAEAMDDLRERLGDYEQITGDALEAAQAAATEVSPETEQWVVNWLTERFNFSQ
ncbi:MAG: tricarboxylate transporter [Inquilinaceae bacterium]